MSDSWRATTTEQRLPLPLNGSLWTTEREAAAEKPTPAIGSSMESELGPKFKNHVVTGASEVPKASRRVFRIIHATIPSMEAQEASNFEFTSTDLGATKYPSVSRTYVYPRKDFVEASPAAGDAMPGGPEDKFTNLGFILVQRAAVKTGLELEPYFMVERRDYIQRTAIADTQRDERAGTTTTLVRTIYRRGENVPGIDPATKIEDLVLDPTHSWWQGNPPSVDARSATQLSDDWFQVEELRVVLPSDSLVSRELDQRLNAWVTISQAAVDAGSNTGSLSGDVLTETKAKDHRESAVTVTNPDLPGYGTISYTVDEQTGLVLRKLRQAVAKSTASPGVTGGKITDVDGDNVQADTKVETNPVSLPGPWFSSFDYDDELRAFIRTRKRVVAKDSETGGWDGNVFTEVKSYSPILDWQIESSFVDDGSVIGATNVVPATFNYSFPPILKAARMVGIYVYAQIDDQFDYRLDYFLQATIVDPTATSVRGRIVRKFVTQDQLDSIMDDYPTVDWGAKTVNDGLLWGYAYAGPAGIKVDARAQPIQIPATVHPHLTIDLWITGVGVPNGGNQVTKNLDVPATANFGSWPEWITIDVDPIQRKLGVWEVQIKQVSIEAFAAAAAAGGVPFVPLPIQTDPNLGSGNNLSWTPDPDGATYEVEVASDPNFNTIIDSATGLTSPTFDVDASVSAGDTYYWRVRSTNGSGSSGWTMPQTNAAPVPGTPGAVTLTYPGDADTNVGIPPELKWTRVAGVPEYRLQIAQDSGFLRPLVDVTIPYARAGIYAEWLNPDGSHLVMQPFTPYYWRVRAQTPLGPSAWSTRSFTTGEGLGPVRDLNLTTETTYPDDHFTFTWNAPLAGVEGYEWRVRDYPSGSFDYATGTTDVNTRTANVPVSALTLGSGYLFEVRGNRTGMDGEWTVAAFYFVPTIPVISSPTPQQHVDPIFEIVWDEVPGATSYHVTVTFVSPGDQVDDTTTGTSYVIPSALGSLLDYTVKVTAQVGSYEGPSTDANTRIVTTLGTPSTITFPGTNYLRGQDQDLTLEWTAAAFTEQYQVEIATDSGFSTIIETGTPTDPEYAPTALDPFTRYWARVKSLVLNGPGGTSWTSFRAFETALEPSILTAPANHDTGVSTTPTLVWGAVTGADDYEIQLATRSDFAINTSHIDAGTNWAPGTLAAATRYYWRVRPRSAASSPWPAVNGPWSTTFDFVTT